MRTRRGRCTSPKVSQRCRGIYMRVWRIRRGGCLSGTTMKKYCFHWSLLKTSYSSATMWSSLCRYSTRLAWSHWFGALIETSIKACISRTILRIIMTLKPDGRSCLENQTKLCVTWSICQRSRPRTTTIFSYSKLCFKNGKTNFLCSDRRPKISRWQPCSKEGPTYASRTIALPRSWCLCWIRTPSKSPPTPACRSCETPKAKSTASERTSGRRKMSRMIGSMVYQECWIWRSTKWPR